MNEPSGEPTVAMPQSSVLNYLTTLSSPTRVRRVAGIGMRLVAVWYGICVTVLGTIVFFVVRNDLDEGLAMGDAARHVAAMAILASLAAALGVAQWLLSDPVRRGNGRACWLANPALVPAAITLLLAALLPTGIVMGLLVSASDYKVAVVILGTIVGCACALGFVIGSLLVIDLARCLLWIARNPTVEKPPLPFLPINADPNQL